MNKQLLSDLICTHVTIIVVSSTACVEVYIALFANFKI
jgi:hypothetical protein